MSDIKNDYECIYLEPVGGPSDEEGRTWCQDNVYDPEDYAGDEAIKYIRADLYEQQSAQLQAAKVENERLRMLIIDHNNDCLESCNARNDKTCQHYTERGRNCCDCSLDWVIEFDGEITNSIDATEYLQTRYALYQTHLLSGGGLEK